MSHPGTFQEKLQALIDERAGGSVRGFARLIANGDPESSRRQLIRWLRGSKPRQATVEALCAKLGLEPSALDDEVVGDESPFDTLLREVRAMRHDLNQIAPRKTA